jgi:peroxiredoxin
MTWIRFGRNEPLAPALPLQGRNGEELDVHRYRRGGTLLLVFVAGEGPAACEPLFAALRRASLHEQEAELLLVAPQRPEPDEEADLPLAFDPGGMLRRRYAELMDVESQGKPLLFVLDRDGSPVYAWVGDCHDADGLSDELLRKLQSAAFLCPECSVPDPAVSASWDVIY